MTVRLFFQIASMEARRRMSYRVDFWLTALVGFVAQFGVIYFLWSALFAESGKTVMGGYTFDALLFYYVAVLLFAKLVRGVEFDTNIAQDIYEGGLNRYLIFPASYFGFKYAQHLGSMVPALLQLAFFGGVSLLFLDLPGHSPVSLSGVLMCIVSLALANLLYFLMSFPLQTTAFWADNVWSLLVALRFITGLFGGIMVPLSLFPEWLERANALLPFRCLFSVPVEALMGRLSLGTWVTAMVVGLCWVGLLAALDMAVWRRGNLQYSGIGI